MMKFGSDRSRLPMLTLPSPQPFCYVEIRQIEMRFMSNPGINKATLRTLEVLSSCETRELPFGVSDLSRTDGITKNMAFRILQTLAEHGYLVRDSETQKYDLGPQILWLAREGLSEDFDIIKFSSPYLRQLHELTGESIFLSIIVGRNHLTIDGVEAHGVRVSHQPRGLLVPLHASPASRVLLAHLSDTQIEDYIAAASPLKRFTPTTITDPDKLRQEVALVREQGFARGYGDHYQHGNYISFPVLDSTGRPHAAITIGGPPNRFTLERIEELLPSMLAVIREMNTHSQRFPAPGQIVFR